MTIMTTFQELEEILLADIKQHVVDQEYVGDTRVLVLYNKLCLYRQTGGEYDL